MKKYSIVLFVRNDNYLHICQYLHQEGESLDQAAQSVRRSLDYAEKEGLRVQFKYIKGDTFLVIKPEEIQYLQMLKEEEVDTANIRDGGLQA